MDLPQSSSIVLLGSLVGGYLLGSIPFGVIATRLGGAGDIRAVGSGNIGATNVLRTGRRDLALITLLGDAAKGAAAVLMSEPAVRLGPPKQLSHLEWELPLPAAALSKSRF